MVDDTEQGATGTHGGAGAEPESAGVAGAAGADASWLALMIARVTLRLSRYPVRRWIGGPMRRRLEATGGYPFNVRTADGVTLAAWYAPATPATPATPGDDGDAPAGSGGGGGRGGGGGALPVVMAHGWLEVKEFHVSHIRTLNRAGHDVITFDHRAHGRSTGRVGTFGVRERHDLAAVIDAGVERGLIRDRVISVGFSLGAATALQHAPDDDRVAGVIAYAPFVDLAAAIRSFREMLAPWIDDRWLAAGFERAAAEADFDIAQADTLAAMRRLTQPVLMIEGGRDRNLPPRWHTHKLAEAKTQGSLEVMTIEQATHCGLCRRANWPGLNAAIRRFCVSAGCEADSGEAP
ncbi:MAG: alpha/beta fold hydrolase [Phycisphaeraceae bacterium]